MDPYTGLILSREIDGEIRNTTRDLLDWMGYIHFCTFGGHVTRVLWIVLLGSSRAAVHHRHLDVLEPIIEQKVAETA